MNRFQYNSSGNLKRKRYLSFIACVLAGDQNLDFEKIFLFIFNKICSQFLDLCILLLDYLFLMEDRLNLLLSLDIIFSNLILLKSNKFIKFHMKNHLKR